MDVSGYRERVLGEPSVVRVLLWLAAPLALAASIDSAYSLADTLWLGRVGREALATPSVSWPFVMLLNTFGFMVSSPVSALVGQYVGAGDYGEAQRVFGRLLGLSLAAGVPLAVAGVLLAPYYALLIGVPGDVYGYVVAYTSVVVAATPLRLFYMMFNMALQSLGDTRTPMKLSIATTAANAVLDPVFIFPPVGLGVVGAALATAVSIALVAGYAAYSLATGRHGLRVGLGDLRPSADTARAVISIGGPVALQHLATSTGFVAMAGIVSRLGTVVMAAYSVGQALLSLEHVITMPLARATSIVVSQSIGAGLAGRARQAASKGAALVMMFTAAIILLVMVWARGFASLFTGDPLVVGEVERMLALFGPSIPFFSVFMVGNAVARASGHTVAMSAIGAARLWGLRVTLSYLLALHLGMGSTGLWLGMALSNYAAGAAALAWIRLGHWTTPVIRGRAWQRAAERGGGGG